MIIKANTGLPPASQPWGRGVETRLGELERYTGVNATNIADLPNAERTATSNVAANQNFGAGSSGKQTPTIPVVVRYVSSTGMFEVTVSVAGLVRDGCILGAGFESPDFPYVTPLYDLPTNALVTRGPLGDTGWTPFALSRSTAVNSRRGLHELSLYYYLNIGAGASSAAYIYNSTITVKAV